MATFTAIVGLALSAYLTDTPAQAADTKAYQKAYAYVLEENWEEAEKAFAKLLTDYPSTAWADDAAFWRCHAKIENELPLEQSYQCLKSFVEKWPGSQWVDDARESMAMLAEELAEQGKPRYLEEVKTQSKNWDKLLGILSALGNIGDDTSIKTVLDYLADTVDPALRAKIVLVLEGSDHASVQPTLLNLLEKDPNDVVRRSAIQALQGNADSKPVRAALEKICLDPNEPELMRSQALEAIVDHDKSSTFLERFITDEANPKLAETAILSLAETQSDEVATKLRNLYGQLKNRDLKEVTLEALAQQDSDQVFTFLAELADKEPDSDMRENAIRALGDTENPKALPYLQRILENAKYSEDQRATAARTIGQLKSAEAVSTLKKMLESKPGQELFEAALDGLVQTESPDLASYLGGLLKRTSDSEAASAIMHALADVGGDKARDQLIDLLKETKN